jgi:hypothetical protein
MRFNREIVEVRPAEHDSRIGGRGLKAHPTFHAGMEPYPVGLN